MKRKQMVMMMWGAAALMSLAACSQNEPQLPDETGTDGTFVISADVLPEISEAETRAAATKQLSEMGVPADKLTTDWVMANLYTRVVCIESGSHEGKSFASANAYNRENPRLAPVPAQYGITMGSLTESRLRLPNYTVSDGGSIDATEAPAYRKQNPTDKLVPEVAEGEGPDFIYFEGYSTVSLPGGKTPVQANVTVRVANTAVCVEFTEAFKSYFPNGATVKMTTKAGLLKDTYIGGYTAETKDNADTPRYFWIRPQQFTLSATATRQNPSPGIFDADVRDLGTFSPVKGNVAPQTLYRCVFDVTNVGNTSDNNGGSGITITVNGEPVYTEDLGDEEMNPNGPSSQQ